ERGERLSQPQKRVGGLGDGFMFGRDVEEGFRGIAKALPLEHAFTQPIRRVADEPIIGISAQERAEGVFGEGIVLAQHISVGEVVYVARGLRRWKRGKRAVADSGVARRWPGHSAVGRRDGRDIERRAGAASGGSADRLIACIRAPAGCGAAGVHRPQRVRRTGRVRVLQGVGGAAAPAGRAGGGAGFCGRDGTADRGAPSSCMGRIWLSSCWLRNCSCSIVPVSCRIWLSSRSMRSTASGPETCAVPSAPADGALRSPPSRSLPLKIPNKPNGRSLSCAQAGCRAEDALIAIKTSADAVVTRSAKRTMLLCAFEPWNITSTGHHRNACVQIVTDKALTNSAMT